MVEALNESAAREAIRRGIEEDLAYGPDVTSLATVAEDARAVEIRDASAPAVKLEASGGLTIDVAAAYAATGVDYLAVGGLTHSVTVLDLGLDFLKQ